jgi:hypothetical protein
MFSRKVCQSGSFNRQTTSRPIFSIQLNCVRFKLQDTVTSIDSQSNLEQRKEERELPAAEQALLAAVSSSELKKFAGVVKPTRFCSPDGLRRPCPAAARILILNGCTVRSDRFCPSRTGIAESSSVLYVSS